jgi:hypothetical protein
MTPSWINLQENMSYDDIMLRSKIEALQKSER